MRRHALALAAYVWLTALATFPVWQHMADSVPSDVGDPVLNTYILAWDTHALTHDPLHLFDANIFYPLPNTLTYSENLVGDVLLALPLTLLSAEPLVGYNFVFLSSFVLAGFGMYLFVLRLTRQPAAAFAAGVAFAFAPYRLAAFGHVQLLSLQWLPFIAATLLRISDFKIQNSDLKSEPHGIDRILRLRSLLSLCIFLWLQVASSLHGALFALLIVLVFAVVQVGRALPDLTQRTQRSLRTNPLRAWRTLRDAFVCVGHAHALREVFIAALLLAVALAPLALPYFAVVDELRSSRPLAVAEALTARPSDFMAAAPFNRLFGPLTAPLRLRPGFGEEQTLFMGVLVPLLALAGLWRRDWVSWWLGGLALAALVLSTNAALTQAIPLAGLMRVPARWGAVLAFALAGLCGVAISEFTKRTGGWSSIHLSALYSLIILAIFVEGLSAPLPLTQVGSLRAQTEVYQFLAQQPDRAAVIELPLYAAPEPEFPEAKRMYASALHWHPLVNGYSGFTPARQAPLSARLKQFPDDESLAALTELAQVGVRYVLVHSGEPGIPRREWVQQNRARALNSGVLRLLGSFGDNDLFEIVR